MRAIRRDPEKRYKHIEDMLHDLRNLEEVKPVPYEPDKPQAGKWRQEVMMAVWIIIALCLLIIALGFLAQYLHH
jgi:serine/threonine-protein kinase